MKYNLAIVGATGNVGREMLNILSERKFPVNDIFPLASRKSAGKSISFGEQDVLSVQDLATFDFSDTEIALFSAGSDVSKEYAPKAAEQGCIVIDNTSYFRMDSDVPLIIPEVNIEALSQYKERNIIANPNCSTIQMLVALKPLHDIFKVKKIVVATYQSVSGAGKAAMDELYLQTKGKYVNQEHKSDVFPKQIAFNCIPHIDQLMDDGNTKEEWKMRVETHKILDRDIQVSATCVRVPVFVGHAEAVYIECAEEIDLEQAKEALREAPGVIYAENYVTQKDTVKEDAVYVTRLRQDGSHALNMWVVADNLRKGAALNAVQIAEHLLFI